MLKRLDVGASYQPSKRTESWIKIKRYAACLRHRSLMLLDHEN